MRIIKENEIVKIEGKGIINYNLPVDIHEVPDIKTLDDARETRLPVNYIYLNGADGVKIFKKDQDVLASLKYPVIRFKTLIKFEDYYAKNNIYKKENFIDVDTFNRAEMFNLDFFRYPIIINNAGGFNWRKEELYEFMFKGEKRIFLTDEELFSICKIKGFNYIKDDYKFISLSNYNYERKRIWFLAKTYSEHENEFIVCPLIDKYFNPSNGFRIEKKLGIFRYPSKKYTIEEKKQTILDLDLRPSDILKISQALFTIANYNDKKVKEEQSKADDKLLAAKEMLNKEKMSNDLKLHTSIILDYYENCLNFRQLKEKYNISSYVIERSVGFRYNDLRKFDVSIIDRKRSLSIREKKLLKIYDMISEEDKKIIIDLMDRQLAENITNVWYKNYEEEPGYPRNINKKYNLSYSDYYNSDTLYKLIYKKSKAYPKEKGDNSTRPSKLSDLILQVIE